MPGDRARASKARLRRRCAQRSAQPVAVRRRLPAAGIVRTGAAAAGQHRPPAATDVLLDRRAAAAAAGPALPAVREVWQVQQAAVWVSATANCHRPPPDELININFAVANNKRLCSELNILAPAPFWRGHCAAFTQQPLVIAFRSRGVHLLFNLMFLLSICAAKEAPADGSGSRFPARLRALPTPMHEFRTVRIAVAPARQIVARRSLFGICSHHCQGMQPRSRCFALLFGSHRTGSSAALLYNLLLHVLRG
jgi:hypothetical protein